MQGVPIVASRNTTTKRRRSRRRRGLALALAVGLLAIGAATADAEVSASGNLFITFNGGISPNALPRQRLAPIAVSMAGKVRVLRGAGPPELKNVTIALNRHGHLESRGLPTCRKRELEAVSSAAALAACRDALVGSGRYRARTTYPEQPAVASVGKILAFNSTSHGQPTILAQVYSATPVHTTSVIDFSILHRPGAYGTVLSGAVPAALGRFSYVKRVSLNLHRIYAVRGHKRSYLSAACAAPQGVAKVSFPFVFASMTFADGRTLSSNLTRTCKVRG